MAKFYNEAGNFMPHSERRQTIGTLAALNAEVVHPVNGDESVLIYVIGAAPVLSLEFTASVDGVNYFPVLAFPFYGLGAALPSFAGPLISDALAAGATQRVYQIRAGQATNIRVRCSLFTSGTATVTINSDSCQPLHRAAGELAPATLLVSATGAASAAVTATLPAVVGLRHYLMNLWVLRSSTAALTPSATPTTITSTNIPGALTLTIGVDVSAQGLDKEAQIDFGTSGLACTAVGTGTTIIAPALTGAIWRINAAYRLGV